MTTRTLVSVVLALTLACGGDDDAMVDAGRDAFVSDAPVADAGTDAESDAGADAGLDAAAGDAGVDAAPDSGESCLEAGHTAGERYAVGDDCNFCDCLADGTSECTARSCGSTTSGCTYAGTDYAYAERFPATDGVNECVCAASGLACTRRDEGLPEEGAILLESMDAQCGDDPEFTGRAVLQGLPIADFTTDFPYERERDLYPETRPDTRLRIRVVYDEGYIVCRLPMPTQPAIDAEVVVEWITEDGAFDEAFHTYLRRNNFGFVDAWISLATAPHGGLDGAYDPSCLDPLGTTFSVQINPDSSSQGSISKICETDILLDVGRWGFE
jgi:hypothetical protein